ncbi:MAG: hypothetical protein BWY17_02722 [Deltaproteobacteria bacterium ADurb.Bin207]|jgi:hypothetical protein|nr:MAG: hypothetical protein BWY17_02722 [Deltaproteobacteria bacterium ADurb.Bin207]
MFTVIGTRLTFLWQCFSVANALFWSLLRSSGVGAPGRTWIAGRIRLRSMEREGIRFIGAAEQGIRRQGHEFPSFQAPAYGCGFVLDRVVVGSKACDVCLFVGG